MKINKEGLELIKHFETLKLKAYKCPAGVWTIGYGHTRTATEGMIISKEWAEQLLTEDCSEAEQCVSKNVKNELNSAQFSALVSWVFNLGCGNFRSSTLLKRLNADQFDFVAYEIKRWNKSGGKVLKGLVRRREAEALLFNGYDWRDYEKYTG